MAKNAGPLLGAGLMIPALLALWIAHQPAAPGQSVRFTGFGASIKSYMELRDKVTADLPHLPKKADAEQIASFLRQLTQSLRQARSNSKQGDIFTPAVAADFKEVVRANTSGAEHASVRKAIRDGNPTSEGNPAEIRMAVNAQYPIDQPVSVVPPSILLKLPELPKQLKYCFVGKNLVLLDAEANLILDYIPQAVG